MGIDLSYRNTGVAILDRCTKEPNLSTVRLTSIQSPEIGQVGFKSLEQASIWINETLTQINNNIYLFKPDIIILEMPAYTQNAKAALAIGMCWGIAKRIDGRVLIVEPSLLKNWSSSKRGDKKTKVKERVLERLEAALGSKASNDNIVDAAGLCLAASDLLSYEIIQTNKQNTDSGTINLKS